MKKTIFIMCIILLVLTSCSTAVTSSTISTNVLIDYQSDLNKNYLSYTNIMESIKHEGNKVSNPQQKMKELQEIYQEAYEIGNKYSSKNVIENCHKKYLSAIDAYINALKELCNDDSDKLAKSDKFKQDHDKFIQEYKDAIFSFKS